MPNDPTWEDTLEVPTWEDTRPTEQDFRRDELAKQTFEARIEGEQAKALSGLADIGTEASKAIVRAFSHVDPTGFSQGLMQQYGVEPTHVIPPEFVKSDVEAVSQFAREGLGNLGIPTEAILPEQYRKPVEEFAAENIAALPEMAPLMAAGVADPRGVGRLFQAQMLQGVPESARQAVVAETPEERIKAGLGAAMGVAFPALIEGHLRQPSVPIPDFVGRQLEMQRGALPPRGETAAPIERVTPEQAALAAERMSAPFEGELPKFEETTPIAVEAPVKSRAQLLAEEVEAAREAADAAFKAKQSGVQVKPTTTLPKLVETLGRDEVAGLVDQWEQGAELHPDGKSITVYADPRNQTGKMRGKTKDFLSWYEEQKAKPTPTALPEGEQVAPPTTATEIKATEGVSAPPEQPALETVAPKGEVKGVAPEAKPPGVLTSKIWKPEILTALEEAKKEQSQIDRSYAPESEFLKGRKMVLQTWLQNRLSMGTQAAIKEVDNLVKSKPTLIQDLMDGKTVSGSKVTNAYIPNSTMLKLGYEKEGRYWKRPEAKPEPQPIGQGPGARTGVTVEAPESYSGTALKNAVADIERAGWGLREAPEHLRKSIPEAWIRAGRTLERDVNAGQKLVDELVADPQGRGLSVDESALLLRHKLTLANEMNAAAEGIHTAKTPLDKAKAEAYYDWAHEKMLIMLDAIKNRGTAWGQEGRWRQVMAREDFSLATLITHREKVLGKKLEPGSPEYNEVKAHADKLQALNTALEERVAKVQADFEASEVRRAMAEAEATKNMELPYHPRIIELAEGYAKKWDAKGAKALENLKAMFGEGQAFSGAPVSPAMLDQAIIYGTSKMVRGAVDLAKWTDTMVKDLGEGFRKHAAQVFNASKAAFEKDVNADLGRKGQATVQRVKSALKAEVGTEGILKKIARKAEGTPEGKLPNINYYLRQLGRRYAAEGIKEEGPFIDRMTADVNTVLPDLTRNDVRAIFGGYAEDVRALSKEPVEFILRDMRGQSQELHKLDLLKQKIMPPKLQERATPSDIQRQLRKQVEAEKRTGGFAPPDPEAQLRSAMQSAETRLTNQITDLQREIDAGQRTVTQKKAPLQSEKLDALRKQRDALKETHDRVFKKPDLTDSERLDIWKEHVKEQIAELQDRRKRGDFQVRKKLDTLKYDNEAIELQFQKDVEMNALKEMRHDDEMSKRTTPQVVKDSATMTARFMHMALAGGEFSAVFKQGATGTFGRPIMTARNFVKSLKPFWSEEAHFRVKHDILTRDNAPDYRGRLEFTDINGRLSNMEEVYMFKMAKWMKGIPGLSHYVKYMDMFQRSFTSFLNLMRADTFDAMKREYGSAPETMDAIANYINVATGRGSKSTARFGGGMANAVFFAPRWSISRFQYLLGQPIIAAGKGNRQMIVNQYARTLVGLGSVYAFGLAAGGTVEWKDPRSSLWGKIQLGGRVIDPLFGLAPVMRIMAQLITGTRKNSKGQIRPVRESFRLPVQGSQKPGPFDPSGAELIGRFAWSKLAPAPETFVAATSGENVIGEKFQIGKRLAASVTPITYKDIIVALKEQGLEPATAIDLMAIWGLGSYIPDKPKQPNW